MGVGGFVAWDFTSHSKNCHSHGDVTITGEGLQILTYTRHSWYKKVRVLQLDTLTVTRDVHLLWLFPRPRDTHTCCRPFGSRVLNAYFNELGLSRPEIEPRSLANVRKNIDFSKTYCIFVYGSLFSNSREINTCTYNCVLH